MWLASVGSIVVISLVGLLAVAALPLLRGRHRKAALQVLHMLVVVGPVVMMVLMMAKLVLEVVVVPNSWGLPIPVLRVVWIFGAGDLLLAKTRPKALY